MEFWFCYESYSNIYIDDNGKRLTPFVEKVKNFSDRTRVQAFMGSLTHTRKTVSKCLLDNFHPRMMNDPTEGIFL